MTNDSSGVGSVMQRFLGRLRHGLMIQEILDRLSRLGFVVYPYIVTAERSADMDLPVETAHVVRPLGPQDATEVARITIRNITEATVIDSLTRARCIGIFYMGRLVGYTWVATHAVPVPGSMGTALFELQLDEAYLFDMFVSPEYRGARLAPLLRAYVLRDLTNEGRVYCYSITLLFNRSSRRFKARLGLREVELRIYLHARFGSLKGLDLRLWRRQPHLRTPLFKQVPRAGKTTHAP